MFVCVSACNFLISHVKKKKKKKEKKTVLGNQNYRNDEAGGFDSASLIESERLFGTCFCSRIPHRAFLNVQSLMFSRIMERVFAAEYLTGLSLMFSRSHKCVLTRVFSEMTLSFF